MHHYDDCVWNIALQAVKKWLDMGYTNLEQDTLDGSELKYLANKLAIGKEIEEIDGQFSSFFLVELAKHLYLEQEMGEAIYQKAYESLWRVWSYLGNIYVFSLSLDIIIKLLNYGSRCSGSTPDFFERDKDLQRMIKSGKYLEKIFGKIPIKCGGFELSNLDDAVFAHLDNNVEKIGGMIFCEYLVNRYLISNGNYVSELDRYMLIRQDEKNCNIPLQLLFNLAGRHLDHNVRRYKDYNKIYIIPLMEETVQIAKSYLDVCGLYGKSGIEYTMMHRKDYIYYIRNEQVYEKMCLPMQYACRYVLGALSAMVEPFWDKLNKKYRFKDYCNFIKASYQSVGGTFTVKQISKASRLPVYKTKAILTDVAVLACHINRDFTSFVSMADFLITPLVCISNEVYLHVDSHFTGIGYYLIIQKQLSNLGIAELGFKQGHYLEQWLKDEMGKNGIPYKSGKYTAKGGQPEGECDIVFEEKQGIYFIELKKQSIMHEFNHIDDVAFYSTLGKGMIHAQVQAFNHELYWRMNRGIELSDGNIIMYDENSRIYKISVCFSEYAFLSSKAFTRIFMDIMFTGEVCAIDASRQRELKKLNKSAMQLKDNIRRQNELYGRDKAELQELIAPIVFCSLQQILTSIWCMKNAAGFYEILKEWICRCDANLDLYVLILVKLYEKQQPEKTNIISSVMVEKAFAGKSPKIVIT